MSYFLTEMQDADFRHAYAEDQIRMRIAFLIRALRRSRDLSQREFANLLGSTQSAVARAEDPEYGNLTVKTLLNVARALDLPLFVDFPEWPNWLELMRDHTAESLERKSFDINDFVVAEPEESVSTFSYLGLYSHVKSERNNLSQNASREDQGDIYFIDNDPEYTFLCLDSTRIQNGVIQELALHPGFSQNLPGFYINYSSTNIAFLREQGEAA